MKKIFFLITFAFSAMLLNAQVKTDTQEPAKKEPNQYAKSKFEYQPIDAPNKTFGYDIYIDGVVKIHQTSIPSMPGNEGFKTKNDAQKVARLAITKIQKGEMPPTITQEELKKLSVIK